MKEQVLATLENSRNYTLSVAASMPEDSYHFKPQGAGWNFGELLHHIAYGIQWWEDNYIKGNQSPWSPPPVQGDKQSVIQYINKAYDALKVTAVEQPLTDDQVKGFYSTLDHITHHRGQAVIYLRGNGITPPEYVY